MLSNFLSTVTLTLLTVVGLSSALQYDLTCLNGASADECSKQFGTYCNPHGILMNPAPSGRDCTTSHAGPNLGFYCFCKFHYIPPPKPTGKFDPNEILQWAGDFKEPATPVQARQTLAHPTFDPLEILQWAGDVEERATGVQARQTLAHPTFDPNEILQWAGKNKERANAVQATTPLAHPTFDPNDILQWAGKNKKRANAVQATTPLAHPTFDPNEILQWPRDVKDNSEDKNEVRDAHIENARQVSEAIGSATGVLGQLTSLGGIASSIAAPLASQATGSPSTAVVTTTNTSVMTVSKTISPSSTVSPVLPSKNVAAVREASFLGLMGAVAVAVVAAL